MVLTEGRIVSLAAGVSLVAGAVTSYLQTSLPFALAPLASSAGSWCALAFCLALLAWRTPTGVLVGMLSLAGLVAGYYVAAGFRGIPANPQVMGTWFVAAFVLGPLLGAAAVKARYGGPVTRVVGSLVLPALLVAEGWWALANVGQSTFGGYWAGEIVLGVGLGCWLVARSLSAITREERNT